MNNWFALLKVCPVIIISPFEVKGGINFSIDFPSFGRADAIVARVRNHDSEIPDVEQDYAVRRLFKRVAVRSTVRIKFN